MIRVLIVYYRKLAQKIRHVNSGRLPKSGFRYFVKPGFFQIMQLPDPVLTLGKILVILQIEHKDVLCPGSGSSKYINNYRRYIDRTRLSWN